MNMNDPSEILDDQQTSDPSDAGFSEEQEIVVEKERKPVNTSAMLLFGLLAAVGAGTYLMCLRAGAQTIRNDPNVMAAETTIGAFLKGGAQGQHKMAVMLRDTEKVVGQFGNTASAHQIPLSDLRGNPFESTEESQAAITVSDATAKQQAEEQQKAADAIVKGLKLESIFTGAHGICMINGKTYSQGQGTDKFTVDKILPQGVWLRIGSISVELIMAPPKMD
jgi:hypothetical protein